MVVQRVDYSLKALLEGFSNEMFVVVYVGALFKIH